MTENSENKNTSPQSDNLSKLSALAVAKYIGITLSVLLNVVVVGYYGFYGHRTQINDELIKQYAVVQEKQEEAVNTIVKTLPSLRTDDRMPNKDEIDLAIRKLDELQMALSKVNTNSEPLDEAAQKYKASIGELTRAIIAMDYDNPPSLSVAQLQFHNLDLDLKYFKNEVDQRTSSFWRTVVSVL